MFSEKFQAALQAIYSSYQNASVGINENQIEREFLTDIIERMDEIGLPLPLDKRKDIEAIILSIE